MLIRNHYYVGVHPMWFDHMTHNYYSLEFLGNLFVPLTIGILVRVSRFSDDYLEPPLSFFETRLSLYSNNCKAECISYVTDVDLEEKSKRFCTYEVP